MYKNQKICLPCPEGFTLFRPDEITFIKADDVYAFVHNCTSKYFISTPLKTIEEIIPKDKFIRCHRSYIINIDKVRKLIKSQNYELIMENGEKVPVSRGNKLLITEKLLTPYFKRLS